MLVGIESVVKSVGKIIRQTWWKFLLTEVVQQTERSEVCSHDSGQDSPIQTDLAQLIRCLLRQKQEQFNLFNVTGLYYM